MKMKGKKTLIGIVGFMTPILFGVMALLLLTACYEYHCCPKIRADSITFPSVVCHPDCPGGGKITVYYTVEFRKKDELCDPKNYNISIYNVTKDEMLPPLVFQKAKTGVYTGKEDIGLDSYTEFELRATGDEECGVAKRKFTVKVIRPGQIERHKLIFTDQKEWQYPQVEWTKRIYFGPGIIVYGVANENKAFGIDVDHRTLHASLAKSGTSGDTVLLAPPPQDIIYADGDWKVSLNEYQYKEYADGGKQPVEMYIMVQCYCPEK
jgi:hypothetical protein